MIAAVAIAVFTALGADWSGASVAELAAQVDQARREYNLPLAQDLLPELERRVYATPTGSDTELRQLLGRTALIVTSLLRYEYEQDANVRQRRELGAAIDEAARVGFSAVGQLPESSEQQRIIADLFAMKMRTKAMGKEFEEAMDTASQRALALDPENPKALMTASRRKLFADEAYGGDFEAGIALLDKAIALDPNDDTAYLTRGIAYDRHGDREKAIADLERALELNPKNVPAKTNLERIRAAG